MRQAQYTQGFEYMKRHDEQSLEVRIENYSGKDDPYEYDPNWNKTFKQVRERYSLTPAQLRRMGIIDK